MSKWARSSAIIRPHLRATALDSVEALLSPIERDWPRFSLTPWCPTPDWPLTTENPGTPDGRCCQQNLNERERERETAKSFSHIVEQETSRQDTDATLTVVEVGQLSFFGTFAEAPVTRPWEEHALPPVSCLVATLVVQRSARFALFVLLWDANGFNRAKEELSTKRFQVWPHLENSPKHFVLFA